MRPADFTRLPPVRLCIAAGLRGRARRRMGSTLSFAVAEMGSDRARCALQPSKPSVSTVPTACCPHLSAFLLRARLRRHAIRGCVRAAGLRGARRAACDRAERQLSGGLCDACFLRSCACTEGQSACARARFASTVAWVVHGARGERRAANCTLVSRTRGCIFTISRHMKRSRSHGTDGRLGGMSDPVFLLGGQCNRMKA